MKITQKYFWPLLILVIGLFGIYLLDKNNLKTKENEAQFELQAVHAVVQNQVSNALDKFVATASGMRSFMNLSEDLPTAEQFQAFVQEQMNAIHSGDSIVVSYINNDHIFIYSFTKNEMDPANLVGKSVAEFRSQDKINALNRLLKTDSILLFPPMNLLEGWSGIPLDFRVKREDSVYGYVAPILNFKTLISDVYKIERNQDFVFHFNYNNSFDFDREMVYNGTESYNPNKDPEYYKNYDIPTEDFVYSNIDKYGATIKVGTAYKNKVVRRSNLIYGLLVAHLLLVLLLILLNKQIIKSKGLNERLQIANVALKAKSKEAIIRNEELKTLNATKDKFFSILGHDIKQPLNSVVGLVELLGEEEIKDKSLRSIVLALKASAQNTSELLSNILKWAMSQTGELNFAPRITDINQLISEQISYLQSQASTKNIALKFEPKEQVKALVDANMLGSVIRNLVSNAIKFSKKEDSVIITLSKDSSNFIIDVIDQGVGMTQQEIKSFFELKTQVSKMGTSGEAGTGLGLMLSHNFVKKHRGSIELTSDQNSGTTFKVIIPLG